MNRMRKALAFSLALALIIGMLPSVLQIKASAEEAAGPVVVWEDSFEIGKTFEAVETQNTPTTADGQNYWNGAAPKSEYDHFTLDHYTGGGVMVSGGVAGAYDGESCIKLETASDDGKLYLNYGVKSAADADLFALEDGVKYVASVWVKFDEATSMNFQLMVKNVGDGSNPKTLVKSTDVAANEWVQLFLPFTYASSKSCQIDMEMMTPGAVYLDKLQILKAEDATGIALDKTTATLEPEQTLQLTAGLNPAAATTKVTYSWESNNENVATVDATGKVTAVAGGTATITATAGVWKYDYTSSVRAWVKTDTTWTAQCAVTVASNSPVVVWEDSFEIGETFTANSVQNTATSTDGTPKWNGAAANTANWWNADIQSGNVMISGGVGGAKHGDSCISLANDPSATGKNNVYLNYNLKNIIGDGELALTDGKMYVLSVWVKYAADTTYTAKIMVKSTKTFAVGEETSNQNPFVEEKAKTTEWTKVEVPFMYDSAKASSILVDLEMIAGNTSSGTIYLDLLQITELVDAEGISVDGAQIDAGEKVTLKPKMTPANASTTVTWSSSDPSVATVDADGVVTGISGGEATITATAAVRNYDFVNRRYLTDKAVYTATCTVTVKELFTLNGALVNLGEDLDMKFFIKPSDLTEGETYTAKMIRTYANGSTDTQEEIVTKVYSDGDYYVTYKGLAAKEMGDKIAVTVYDSQGNAVSKTWTDSIKDYVYRAMEKYSSDAAAVAMLEDMLNYGAAAQTAFGYNAEALVNADLDKQVAEVTGSNVSENNDRDYWNGAELRLEGAIVLKSFFKSTAVTRDMKAEVSFTNYRGNAVSYTVDGADFGQDVNDTDLYVPVTGLVIGDADTAVTIVIKNAEDQEVVTVTDSIASYTIRYNGLSNADENFVALNNAIMALGATAETYLLSK